MEEFIAAGVMKRRVLVVDDEIINREILGAMLSKSYEVSFAENGRQAMDALTASDADYSLVLLDLIMPVMDGFEVIRLCRSDEALRRIPIIVMTSEKTAEVRSIRMGAADFITKPYEMPEVILARCERIIEMSEDKSIIRSTERDKVSGLYTRDYFFAYMLRMLPHMNTAMDAIVLNINRFNLINELYGRQEGDRVLKRAGELIGEMLSAQRGIACRSENDIFFIFIEQRESYDGFLQNIQEKLGEFTCARNVTLRAGIYSCEGEDSDPEKWFGRAKAVCDSIRGQFGTLSARYSRELYDRAIFRERLIADMQSAIDDRNFTVYYQPKYDIRGEAPKLTSAEALVRWIHPELGFISPGDFIPLFEHNGLISKVDYYVWREAARQIQLWREQYGVTVPVSVNVSRVDVFDPMLEAKLTGLRDDYSLGADDLLLEITESAYSDNAENLIEVVNRLRGHGFKIEMDDFGSGYSSLNMLTSFPIDVLKLDMQFIRNMLTDSKSLRLVELIIDIAEFLKVAVVAEGVEREEQLNALKKMGCDIVQGFYFAAPMPAERFSKLIEKECKK